MPVEAPQTDPIVSWNLVADMAQLLGYPFMRHALLVGTLIALVAGVTGYFVVLRGQSFAGHTLANVGFAGAAGAALVGVSPVVGLLAACLLAATGIGLLAGQRGAAVAIAIMQTTCLAFGLLFERLTSHYAAGIYSLLFGSLLGITDRDVWTVAVTALVAVATMIVIGRPLLFTSLDPVVAEARGVPVRGLALVFLLLLAVAVAQAVLVVGVLLIFSLLVTPAAVAQRLTMRPAAGIALAMLLALLFTWAGLVVAYFTPYPVGFFVSSIAFGSYLLVRALPLAGRSRSERLSSPRIQEAK
jgi:zinc/manganese transport system permease protein